MYYILKKQRITRPYGIAINDDSYVLNSTSEQLCNLLNIYKVRDINEIYGYTDIVKFNYSPESKKYIASYSSGRIQTSFIESLINNGDVVVITDDEFNNLNFEEFYKQQLELYEKACNALLDVRKVKYSFTNKICKTTELKDRDSFSYSLYTEKFVFLDNEKPRTSVLSEPVVRYVEVITNVEINDILVISSYMTYSRTSISCGVNQLFHINELASEYIRYSKILPKSIVDLVYKKSIEFLETSSGVHTFLISTTASCWKSNQVMKTITTLFKDFVTTSVYTDNPNSGNRIVTTILALK